MPQYTLDVKGKKVVIRRPAIYRCVRAAKGASKTVRFGYKYRRRLAPVYMAAAASLAGGLCSLPEDGYKQAFVVCLLYLLGLRRHLRRRVTKHKKNPLNDKQRAYVFFNSVAGASLVISSSALSPVTPPIPGLIFLWWLGGLGAPWWYHYRVRTAEVPNVDKNLSQRETLWNNHLGAEGKKLAGSQLTEIENIGGSDTEWRSIVELGPEGATADIAISSVVNVAKLYDLPTSSVVIERTPSGSERRVKLEVYKNNPLEQVNYWVGPESFDVRTGIANIGRYADSIPVDYQFWRPKSGPVHTLISGTTDSGKSRLVDELLAIERTCGGYIVSRVADPQYGQSLPDWQDNVDHFAKGPEESALEILVMRDVMFARNQRYSGRSWVDEKGRTRKGKGYFVPGLVADGKDPVYSLTVDEAHKVFSQFGIAVKAAEEISSMARKCGGKLRLITQLPLLKQLGNSHPLRSAVASGNVIVLRTADRITTTVAFQGAFDVQPHLIQRAWPDRGQGIAARSTAGLGYALGPQARTSIMRVSLIDDVFGWATEGETWHLGPEDQRIVKLSTAKWEKVIWPNGRENSSSPTFSMDKTIQGVAIDSGDTQGSDTKKDAILNYLRGVDSAHTGVIAKATCNGVITTASTTLGRLEIEGKVIKLGLGKWQIAAIDELETETDNEEEEAEAS